MQKPAGTEDTTTLYNGTRMAATGVKHAEQRHNKRLTNDKAKRLLKRNMAILATCFQPAGHRSIASPFV